MIKILQGGHWQKKGYYYILYITLPSFSRGGCRSLIGKDMTEVKLEMPTGFNIMSNNYYMNIRASFIGFGIGLQMKSKS